MIQLVIDIGNTAFKVATFDNQYRVDKKVFLKESEIIRYLKTVNYDHVIVSDVRGENHQWLPSDSMILSHTLQFPFINQYKSKTTLGTDRLAGVSGAVSLYPNRNVLIIDMGTCITYDLLTKDAKYQGGGISPGIRMKFKALNNFTGKLPLVEEFEDVKLVGQSTIECIQSGVLMGTLGEIESIISKYGQLYENLVVLMTGGDTKYFETKIKAPIFVNPDLVLVGLNTILLHNVKN